MPIVVGITGNIGSGKSTCTKALKEKGAIIIDADKLGHEAYAVGSLLIPKLVNIFGPTILQEGEIHRPTLGKLVFGNPERRQRLTELIWPEIRRSAEKTINEVRSQRGSDSIIVIEAAVLLEANWTSLFDHIILLKVRNESELRRRLSSRDPKLSSEDISERLAAQMPFEKQIERLKESKVPYTVLNAERPLDELLEDLCHVVAQLSSGKCS